MRYFCNFSIVSLGIRPRSRRYAERTRQGKGRWSRPPKAALERSYIRPRIPVPRIAYFGRDEKKLLTKSLTPKKDFIYIYVSPFTPREEKRGERIVLLTFLQPLKTHFRSLR